MESGQPDVQAFVVGRVTHRCRVFEHEQSHECDARWLMRLPMDACLIALIKIHAARRDIGLARQEGGERWEGDWPKGGEGCVGTFIRMRPVYVRERKRYRSFCLATTSGHRTEKTNKAKPAFVGLWAAAGSLLAASGNRFFHRRAGQSAENGLPFSRTFGKVERTVPATIDFDLLTLPQVFNQFASVSIKWLLSMVRLRNR